VKEKKPMPKIKRRREFWVVITILFFLICAAASAAVLTLVRYSGRHERSCRQCHPEIYQLWKSSKGHPSQETSCFECHAHNHPLVPPEYIADDDLTAVRCLDCHEDVLDFGYQIKRKIVKFNHRQHIHEGLDCVDCHRTAGHETMAEGTNRPSISECQDCHLKEFQGPPRNQQCLNCHDVILAPGKE